MRRPLALVLAITAVIALSVLTTVVVKYFDLADVMQTSGFTWLVALQPLTRLFERFPHRFGDDGEAGPDDSFQPWPVFTIICTVAYLGATQIGGFVVGLAAAVLGGTVSVGALVVSIGLVLGVVTAAVLGFYVGSHATTRHVTVLLTAGTIGRALGALVDYALLDDAAYQEAFDLPRTAGTLALAFVLQGLVGLVLAAAVGLPLLVVGRRRRAAPTGGRSATETFRRGLIGAPGIPTYGPTTASTPPADPDGWPTSSGSTPPPPAQPGPWPPRYGPLSSPPWGGPDPAPPQSGSLPSSRDEPSSRPPRYGPRPPQDEAGT